MKFPFWKRKRQKSKASKVNTDVHKALQCKGARIPIGLKNINELLPGDHVAWKRSWDIWHHAIVVETDDKKIKMVDFMKANKQFEIVERWVDIRTQNGQCFRFNYTADVTENNPPIVVLGRARSMLGRTDFHLIKNNCEHLASFCKTGVRCCIQNRTAVRKLLESASTCAASIRKAVFDAGCDNIVITGKVCTGTATNIAIFGRVDTAAVMKAAVVVAILEIGHCVYDSLRLIQNRNRDNMTKTDFNISITERVFEAVGSGGLTIACSIACERIGGAIGIVVTGSAIPYIAYGGNVVGHVIGSIIGKMVGSMFGTWFGKLLWKY